MKKLLLLAAIAVVAVSCGEKKLSDAEIEQKVNEAFEAQKAELTKKAEEACNANFDAYVKAATDSIVNAKVAEYQAANPPKK